MGEMIESASTVHLATVENAGKQGYGIWLKPEAPPEWANYRSFDRWAKHMWRFNSQPGGIRVWDAGSGSGTRFKTLRSFIDPIFKITIVATDLQEDALTRFPKAIETTKNPRDSVFTIQADITKPPPFSLPVTGISCLSVFPWLDIEGSKQALTHFYSQLEEDGALILELCTPYNQVALFAEGTTQDDLEIEFRIKKMLTHFAETNNKEPLTIFNQKYNKNVVVHTQKCATNLLTEAGFTNITCTNQHNMYFPNGIHATLEERFAIQPSWNARHEFRSHENLLLFATKEPK
ncbi:MAG: hypothetical protein GW762_03915 [Candidatus Pacebacteria bacterium]|nr:hypothetical protein [Candidatus Paceibacterota bacterium]PIR63348.1 MAG: hypothetical protein COU64_05205 [Candidatus Pacebacteria bacterium CG10_big_fil_rev_8_21_14_0_10_40_26]PIZ79006.1 MAG: hypothetical protein COY01_01085 [Candidatus Pacebacteria bacterium CG_4_10_14_0_2_um_filter_40_20]PJA68548.1 MAG: hypothetical protein CO156_04935 [Candidatus Pacebacteria bacterium CG_4_9_14_3_um_filter_40_12]PJC41932.1 MAG: hypothetical protein CO041_02185 [Candidatus Pacebacteria bacterium CG_4_9_